MTDPLHRNALFDLTGRTALITGASAGIGARFAKLLAMNGANVVLAARREDKLAEQLAAIKEFGGRAITVAMDVSDEQSTREAFDKAEGTFGTVDTIIANAGIAHDGAAIDLSADELENVLSVNVKGSFLTAREGMLRMRETDIAKRGDGRIIFTSSITAKAIVPGVMAYGASKAALTHMGRSLAREWARHGVNVNVLAPGYILTEINAYLWDQENGKRMMSRWPRRRVMDIDALDGAMLFLASSASRYLTGTVLDVDDGQML